MPLVKDIVELLLAVCVEIKFKEPVITIPKPKYEGSAEFQRKFLRAKKDAKRKNKNVSREIAIKKDAKKTNKTPSKSYLANKKKKRISEMSLREKISSLTTDEGYSFGDLRRAISALTRRN